MATSSQAASALSRRTSSETPLLLHLKRLPSSLHGLTFPELFFNPPGQPKRQLSSSERLALEGLSPDLLDLYLNDSESTAPRRCFALVRGEELLLFAVDSERFLPLGSQPAASMGDRSLFVSCDRPLLERLFPTPLWEMITALNPSGELLIAESSPMGALRSWAEPGREEALLAPFLRAFPDLKSEVNLNAPDSRRRASLHRAVLAGKFEDATALIEAGAERDPKDLDGKTPLHLAVIQGDLLMVKALLDLSCDPLARTSEGENLLHLAVSKESLPLVGLLLQRPEAQTWLVQGDSDGKRPLHRAIWGDPKPGLVELLLRAGAEVNAPNRYGYTALHWAAKHGHFESARLLLDSGARIDLSNQNQETPVDLALRWGQPAIVWLFLGGEEAGLPELALASTSGASSSSASPSDPMGTVYAAFEEAHERGQLLPQLFWLQRLGELHIERGEFISAAHCLNGALSLLLANSSRLGERQGVLKSLILSQLERVEGLALEAAFQRKTPAGHRGYLIRYREELESIRSRFAERLAGNLSIDQAQELLTKSYFISLEELESIEEPESIRGRFPERLAGNLSIDQAQELLTKSYRNLLIALIEESIALIGQGPPSGFAVMGLGSMGRMEMCPYSDLEFAFLIDNPSPQRLDYFRKLSELLTLKMVNMGETKCELVRFKRGKGGAEDRPEKSLVSMGFSLDIGGLCPSGKRGVYELIGTPQQLAQFQTQEWLERHDAEIILVNALTLASYLTGDRALVDSYQKEVSRILNTNIGGFLPWDRKKLRKERAFQLMRGFVNEFHPRLDQDKIDLRAFDVKQELYRLPQTVVSGLALYYGLKGTNTLQRIEGLRRKGILSPEGAGRLKEVFQSVLKLRAETHLFYRTEREILYHPRAEEAEGERLFVISPAIDDQLLAIYQTLLPLHEGARAFLAGDPKVLAHSSLHTASIETYDDRLREELGYEGTLQAAQRAVALKPDSSSQHRLGLVHLNMGQAQKALESLQEAYLLLKKERGDRPHSRVADILNDLGLAHKTLGETRRAIDCQKQSLAIYKQIHGDRPHLDVADSLMRLGNAYQALGETRRAIHYHKQSLAMNKRIHGDRPYPDAAKSLNHLGSAYQAFWKRSGGQLRVIATSLNNLGLAYKALGETARAIQYYEPSLATFKQIHRDQPHLDVAMTLMNLGLAYKDLGETRRAIDHYEQSLAIYKQLHGDRPHPAIANSLMSLGNAYQALGETRRAIDHYEQSLAMNKRIHGDRPHPDVANSLNHLGSAYKALGKTRRAIDYHEQSLAIYKQLYGDRPHPDVANSLNHLGSAYKTLGETARAIDYHEQSLVIYKQLYGDRPHPDVANSLNHLGSAYKTLGETARAINYYEQSLAMNKRIRGDRPHPDVANSLIGLGSAYQALGETRRAINYYEESLVMRKQLYSDQPHLDVVHSLIGLGNAYSILGETVRSIYFYEQSLKTKKGIHGDRPHPDVAKSLTNLGSAYQALGETARAIDFYKQSLAMNKRIRYHEQSLAIYKQLHGDRPHPDVAKSLANLGSAYQALGETAYHEQSLAMNKQLHGNRPHPDVATSLANLGSAYQDLGETRHAINYYEQSLAIKKELYGDRPHPNVDASLNNLGVSYDSLGETRRAIDYYEQSLVMRKQIHGDRPHPDVADSLNNLGLAYKALGETARAIDYHEQSLVIRKQIHGDRPHPDVARSLAYLGNAYLTSGNRPKAVELLESAYEMFLKTVGAEHSHAKWTKKRLDAANEAI